MSETPLKGKVALVTGASRGIGEFIAKRLAQAGAAVGVSARTLDEGDHQFAGSVNTTVNAINDAGGIAAAFRADLGQHEDRVGLVAAVAKEFGPIDILVNNAGIQHVANIEDFPIEKWDAMIAINLSSSFHTIRAAVAGMKARKWGRIINIASAHGLVASVQKVAYVSAKHGLIGLTKVVAMETANAGVTCNAICPGWVLTPLVQQQIDARAKASSKSVRDEEIALLSEKQPMHQFTKPESIGALAVFLCSDAAATITGSAYPIDGGWVAQ